MANLKPNLTQDKRNEIVQYLMDRATNVIAADGTVTRNLPRGIMSGTATKFDIHRNTVTRIWKGAKENFADKKVMKSVSKIKENSGRHKKYDRAMVKQEIIDNFDGKDSKSLRNISKKLGIGYGTVWNMVRKEGMDVSSL